MWSIRNLSRHEFVVSLVSTKVNALLIYLLVLVCSMDRFGLDMESLVDGICVSSFNCINCSLNIELGLYAVQGLGPE